MSTYDIQKAERVRFSCIGLSSLLCETTGLWSGPMQSCPPPVSAPTRCTSPFIPKYASAENVRLAYSIDETVTITCDSTPDRSFTLQCKPDGFWTGGVHSCPPPSEVPEKCSAPYVPRYATIQGLQLNYDYGDSITVTCDSSTAQFTLRCRTKGRWGGQEVSCPVPTPVPEKCSAPYVPRYATIQNLQLNYDYDDSITVTCDSSTAQFILRCHTKGQWSGQEVSCPIPTPALDKCSAPYVSRYATIQNLQLNYDYGDSITVTCDSSSARFTLRCGTKGQWSGQEVSCPVPTTVPEKCSAPYVPRHATIPNLQLNYDYGDSITVTCDNSSARFTLQCDTKGRWSGQEVSCPVPTPAPSQCSAPVIPRHSTIAFYRMTYNSGDDVIVTCDANSDRFTLHCNNSGIWSGPEMSCREPVKPPTLCSAPYIPRYSSIESHHLNYNNDETVSVTCDTNSDQFTLRCQASGLWDGPDISCAAPTLPKIPASFPPSHASCSAPAVPIDSTIQNLRLSYKDGDRMNVTCNVGSDWFDVSCDDGIWIGQNIVCPDPPKECNPPIIPVVSFMGNVKPRYKIGDQVNITCNDDSDWFAWECHTDGLWRGNSVQCSTDCLPPGGEKPSFPERIAYSSSEQKGRDYFITGLLVTAVILFILVLMCMAAFVIFVRNRGYDLATSSKDNLQDEKGSRGPLPDVPDGYAKYIGGDQSLYVEPYLKQSGDPIRSYEVYEKPT
ncbi:CUB and sushi domain-containing protein 3-like [Strongylocentrotus purpuratus]|uniref:Sushi domain-containing protein n=1 Tax=Strongylocentrotus purpuratus TaxID=7668 RepID=A0A7M7P1Q8_STRPU|nr:CUB and sushi domain-containing protein 3-like [Strongylocentrotus purpuratus]